MKTTYAAVLISPTGEEWFLAYGPDSKDIEQAVPYVSEEVANRGALQHFGRSHSAFWNSEREAAARAEKKYRGWTHRVETILSPVEP